MIFLLDVNLLMALLWENHEHHLIARRWFRSVNGFLTCPVAQLGFARVSSHPLLGYGMTPDQAFGVLRHCHQGRAKTEMGSGEGTVYRRRLGECDARPQAPRLLATAEGLTGRVGTPAQCNASEHNGGNQTTVGLV